MTVYIDASAAVKLLAEEAESDALAGYIDTLAADELPVASCMLLDTELRRFARRTNVAQSSVSAVLARIDLVEPDGALFTAAGLLPGTDLRSLDALHLATALRIGASEMLAYDHRLTDAAVESGVHVRAPA